MPELPEVETVRRGLAPTMENACIDRLELRRADLRFPFPEGLADLASGRRIVGLGRRAKFLPLDQDGGGVIVSHLGMSGSYRLETGAQGDLVGGHAFHHERSKDTTHDHMVFHLSTEAGPARVIYNDPRRFGYVQYVERRAFNDHPSFRQLGPEPVGNALNAAELAKRLAGRKTSLKAALLDQRTIAGLGNIYVCEALWRSGLSPRRQAATLVTKAGGPRVALKRLVDAVRAVIAEAIDAGGSRLRDHVQADGSLGYFQHSIAAYDREGQSCRTDRCNGTIKRIVQSGRSTFYCPQCQK